uniref:Fructose-1,6-bisphosphatase, cytosolic n=1 Tax=Noctiluca scintillans TaxID=2966 RepID=A0A7S1A2B6_NOCSC|mmetsp:Transcript_28233/g.74510  ORF Transcript_28233/g.74510 Transcript_28233/m.74510 type:complete len:406 (+) Transcript_28233:85-1302(+)
MGNEQSTSDFSSLNSPVGEEADRLTQETTRLRAELAASRTEQESIRKRMKELEAQASSGNKSAPNEFDPYLNPDLTNRIKRSTLPQYIINSTRGNSELAMVMSAIAHACKVVANSIELAGPAGLYGLAGQENSTGDDVKKLDVISNDIWIECLSRSGVCCMLVSEENEDPIIIEDEKKCGPYCVAFDPLDGSSNIDCNVSVGSIFAIYRRESPFSAAAVLSDVIRPGTAIVVAGYCMYGAATELVVTFGSGVQRFALDPALGEFTFVSDMKMDPKGGKKIFSCNEGNSLNWDPPILKFVEECKDTGYAGRYVGSMVSDVHRTLLYGGIFLYPADKKSTKGKLRVLYEGFPMALITEQAGGVASTGMFKGKIGRILEVMPEHIHDRCPIIMGSARDVEAVLKLYGQ